MAMNKSVPKKGQRKNAGRLLSAFYFIVVAGFIAFVAGLGLVYYFVHDIPPFTMADQLPSETSFVLDANGATIAKLHQEQNRVTVPLANMPKHLVDGVIVMEDIRFYSHFGISPRDLIRAAYLTLTGQDFQGASTITQQVARNRILRDQRVTIRRKVQEIYVALRIEREYSKTEILETYLNEIFLGGSAHGFQAAAQQYFGKNVSDLSLAESAMLVGILPSPNAWRPRSADMAPARRRQAIVLEQMVRHDRITDAERDAAIDAPITLVAPRNQPGESDLAMYFVDHVITQVEDILMQQRGITRAEASAAIHNEGLTIKTTLNLDLQRAAERAALEIFTQENGILQRIQREARSDRNPEISRFATEANAFTWANAHGLQPQVSMLVIEPSTGFIRAWLGGRDMIGRFGRDRVAGEQNQPGSAIKPLLVYGPALAAGRITAASTIDDAPVTYPTGNPQDPLYVPRNFDFNTFWGHTSIRKGLARSYNVMAVKLYQSFGVRNAVDWAKRLGITSIVERGPRNDMGLATALGGMTNGMTLLEQVRAYNVFNNRGVLVEPSAILSIATRGGSVIYNAPAPAQQIVTTEQVAWLMTDILRGTVDSRDGVTGTGFGGLRGGTMGRFAGQAAGKTGTTDGNADALFLGYTPNFTVGVWIGHDDLTTGIPSIKDGAPERRPTTPPPLAPAPANETPEARLQRILRSDPFVRGGFPSTGNNAVGSGFATAIFGRMMSIFTTGTPAAQLPRFGEEWYEEYGVFGPPRRLGFVRQRFSAISGKYPSDLTPSEDIRYDWFVAGTEPRPQDPCDMHVVVRICTESDQLATPFCPPASVVSALRVRRAPYAVLLDRHGNQIHPEDSANQVPFDNCTVHAPPTGAGGNGGGN